MANVLILDTDALIRLCDDGTQALDALLSSGRRIFVPETALAELMAHATAVLPKLPSLWAYTWVTENLLGLDYAGVAAVFSGDASALADDLTANRLLASGLVVRL